MSRQHLVTDLEYISKEGMLKLTPKPSPSTVTAYLKLPMYLREAIDQTAVFRFRQRLEKLDSEDSTGKSSKNQKDRNNDLRINGNHNTDVSHNTYCDTQDEAEDYLTMLKSRHLMVAYYPQLLLGLKCVRCSYGGDNYIEGGLSFVCFDGNNEVGYPKLIANILQKRLEHNQKCSATSALSEENEDDESRTATFDSNDPDMLQFVKEWVQDIRQAHFAKSMISSNPLHNTPNSSLITSTKNIPVNGNRDNNASSPNHGDQSYDPNRKVIGVKPVSIGMIDTTPHIDREVIDAFWDLAEPFRVILTHLSVCKFEKTAAFLPRDGEKYSKLAAEYLDGTTLDSNHDISSLVGLKCNFCLFETSVIPVAESSYSVDYLTRILGQHVRHTVFCEKAKLFFGKKFCSLVDYKFNKKDRNVQSFVTKWIHYAKNFILSSDNLPSPSLNPQENIHSFAPSSPLRSINGKRKREPRTPSPTVNATTTDEGTHCEPSSKRPRVSTLTTTTKNSSKLSATKAEMTTPTTQTKTSPKASSKESKSTTTAIATKTPPNILAKKPKVTASSHRKLFQSLKWIFDDELDDLQWFMLERYDDVNEEKIKNSLPPLPAPKQDLDFWIPLKPQHLASYPLKIVPFLPEILAAKTSADTPKKLKQSPNEIPAGVFDNVKPHDVVIPSLDCSSVLNEQIHNQIGNHRFLQLVSSHRDEFANLTEEKERQEFAQKIINEICQRRNGRFQRVNFRPADRQPFIWPCSKKTGDKEVLDYTILRLLKGFPDVLNPELPPIAPRAKVQKRSHLSKRSRGSTRVLSVEHAPQVGIVYGYLGWNNGANDNPKIKLSEISEY